jgi:succinate-semialdehyde dehydrogenase/glutarate-semialdehyde dehydrogenase
MSATAESTASNTFRVMDPATGKEVGVYRQMTADEVGERVAWARRSFPAWSQSSLAERSRILRRAAAILAEEAGRYAEEIAAENGKTRFEALLTEIYGTADLMVYYAKNARKFLGPVRVSGSLLLPFRKVYYRFEPKGVIGIISPWNYPLSLSAGPVVSAVAAGNTVVLKPSSQTTRSGLIVKEVLDRAGLPAGVVEVVTGSGSGAGQALVDHPDLDMLYFTGSTEVGRGVNLAAARRLIPAVMELGGKDVAIVTRNADLDRAANGVAWASFTNCGQTCIATELILVDRSVYEPFVERLTRVVQELKPGKRTGEVGSMTMASQLRIVEEQLEDARKKGARVLTGGKRPDLPGMFFYPTLLADTTPEMKVRTDETFGPLKPIIPFDTIDEAIALANSSEYGLSGSVYTQDREEGQRIARQLKTGSVNINEGLMTQAFPGLPFGGVKKSGLGRSHGIEGLRAFTDLKSITEYYGKVKRELIWYPMPEGGDRLAEQIIRIFFSGGVLQKLGGVWSAINQFLRMRKKWPGV